MFVISLVATAHLRTLTCRAIDSESLVDRVWSGHMTMRDLVTIKLSAFRTSGSMKLIRKVIFQ